MEGQTLTEGPERESNFDRRPTCTNRHTIEMVGGGEVAFEAMKVHISLFELATHLFLRRPPFHSGGNTSGAEITSLFP